MGPPSRDDEASQGAARGGAAASADEQSIVEQFDGRRYEEIDSLRVSPNHFSPDPGIGGVLHCAVVIEWYARFKIAGNSNRSNHEQRWSGRNEFGPRRVQQCELCPTSRLA